jgi:hypothetical protein
MTAAELSGRLGSIARESTVSVSVGTKGPFRSGDDPTQVPVLDRKSKIVGKG